MKEFPKTEMNNDTPIYQESNIFNSSEVNILDDQGQNIDKDKILNTNELQLNPQIGNTDKSHNIYKSEIVASNKNIEKVNINNNLFTYPDNVREQVEKKENENIKIEEIKKENLNINNNQNKKDVNEMKLININKNNTNIVIVEKNNEKSNWIKFEDCCKKTKKVCKVILFSIFCIAVIIAFFMAGGSIFDFI